MYKSETELVKNFIVLIQTKNSEIFTSEYAVEFNYSNGKVDVIALNEKGNLISFEAKLKKWKEALNQAYRNTSFSHYSYVVLPENQISNALKKRNEFEKRGVGLCKVNSTSFSIEIPAIKRKPLIPHLTKSAKKFISEQ